MLEKTYGFEFSRSEGMGIPAYFDDGELNSPDFARTPIDDPDNILTTGTE